MTPVFAVEITSELVRRGSVGVGRTSRGIESVGIGLRFWVLPTLRCDAQCEHWTHAWACGDSCATVHLRGVDCHGVPSSRPENART